MKIRLRNILLLFVVSLSLNGGAGNFSTRDNENRFEVSPISVECRENSPVDVDLPALAIRKDSIMVIQKIEAKDFDTTSTIKSISINKEESSPKEEKITMLDLLVKWITLLLELS